MSDEFALEARLPSAARSECHDRQQRHAGDDCCNGPSETAAMRQLLFGRGVRLRFVELELTDLLGSIAPEKVVVVL